MKKNNKVIVTLVAIIAVIGIATISNMSMIDVKGNITVNDMLNRTNEIPSDVKKGIATSSPSTAMIYMLAPEKLAGLNSEWLEKGKYVPTEYQKIPIIGGWFARQDGNYEEMLSVGPDVILEGSKGSDSIKIADERQKKFGEVPVLAVTDTTNIGNMGPSIEFTAKILGGNSEKKADKLLNFYNTYTNKVKNGTENIPDSEKKKVYYAEGPEGLQTDPDGSEHSQLITYCGGINIADVPVKKGVGQVKVSLEQVISWNPDVIITTDPVFYKKVYRDSNWADLKAVKEKQVYLSPQVPWNWFDRTHGPNRIVGIPWTAKVLYPDKFKDIDIKNATKEFYSEFYHYELTDVEINDLLKNSGLKEENL